MNKSIPILMLFSFLSSHSFSAEKEDLNKKIEEALDPRMRAVKQAELVESAVPSAPPPPKCEIVDKYIVRTLDEVESNGQNIRIYLSDGKPMEQLICNSPTWELVLAVPDKYMIYELIRKDLLFLDSGTGPGERGVVIYDLKTKKKMFDGSGRDDCGKGFISEDKFEYCLTEDAKVSCSKAEIKASEERGLLPVTGRIYELDLKTFKSTKTTSTSCQEDQ